MLASPPKKFLPIRKAAIAAKLDKASCDPKSAVEGRIAAQKQFKANSDGWTKYLIMDVTEKPREYVDVTLKHNGDGVLQDSFFYWNVGEALRLTLSGEMNVPLILFIALQNTTNELLNHLMTVIIFPKGGSFEIDIVGTYYAPPHHRLIKSFIEEQFAEKDYVIRNIPLAIVDGDEEKAFNLQDLDDDIAGWCAAWSFLLAKRLTSKSKAEFWGADWNTRKATYLEMYTSLADEKKGVRGHDAWNEVRGSARRKTRRLGQDKYRAKSSRASDRKRKTRRTR